MARYRNPEQRSVPASTTVHNSLESLKKLAPKDQAGFLLDFNYVSDLVRAGHGVTALRLVDQHPSEERARIMTAGNAAVAFVQTRDLGLKRAFFQFVGRLEATDQDRVLAVPEVKKAAKDYPVPLQAMSAPAVK